MEAITASVERSMQNCSLTGSGGDGGDNTANTAVGGYYTGCDMTVDLNSDVSLPYQWEQCLDKTGEVYYINWRNGMKAKEYPRQATSFKQADDYNSEEESSVESEDGDDDTSSSP